MTHQVVLENTFRGPLDLLLYLVRRDEIDVHDIPIAHLTREYMKELDRMQDLDIDLAGDFLAMASMLMEIKSRMLLPPAESLPGEEDEGALDPRSGLVQALLEYKRFKEAAAELGSMQDEFAMRIPRLPPLPDAAEQEGTIDELGVMDLFAAFNNMVRQLLVTEAHEIISEEVPTEVRIAQIREALAAAGETRFSLLLSSEPSRHEMVGFFIALMELIRLREVRARQAADFADIHIEPRRDAPAAAPPAQAARGPRPRLGLISVFPAPRRAAIRGGAAAKRAPPPFPSPRRLPRSPGRSVSRAKSFPSAR